MALLHSEFVLLRACVLGGEPVRRRSAPALLRGDGGVRLDRVEGRGGSGDGSVDADTEESLYSYCYRGCIGSRGVRALLYARRVVRILGRIHQHWERCGDVFNGPQGARRLVLLDRDRYRRRDRIQFAGARCYGVVVPYLCPLGGTSVAHLARSFSKSGVRQERRGFLYSGRLKVSTLLGVQLERVVFFAEISLYTLYDCVGSSFDLVLVFGGSFLLFDDGSRTPLDYGSQDGSAV
jgi:hypothetical protein